MSLSIGLTDALPSTSVPSPAGTPRPPAAPAPPLRSAAPTSSQDRGVQFQVDAATGQTIVRVVNMSTGEVVRQIPDEVVMRIAQFLKAECGNCESIDLTA
jgi:flagellar protein FlaG